ncbi:MAG: 50S ribosomal protein L22 [Acidimicrobiales bacterium]
MTGPKLNERPGTRAVLRHCGTSAFKVRAVLDLVRGHTVAEARDILQFCERDAAILVGKLVASAVANAENNDGMDPEELYVSACYADEGTTAKRWRPRARGRATRIRKRSCHITVVVSRLPEARLARLRAGQAADPGAQRSRRVAGGRASRPTRRDQQAPGTAAPPPSVTPAPTTVERVAEGADVVEPEPVEALEIDEAGTSEAPAETAEAQPQEGDQ